MSDTPMTPEALATVLVELPGWKHDADTLAKTFVFDDFREALTFMLRVGFEADALDHHPEWTNIYNQVAVKLSTRSAGNQITGKDIELARVMERVRGT